MKHKQIILPNTGMYPILPEDMVTDHVRTITAEFELDHYLAHINYVCSVKKSFVLSKADFYEYMKTVDENFYAVENCNDCNKKLIEKNLLYIAGEHIFLTHTLICESVKMSGKIGLEHILFDDIPGKSEIERLSPDRFFDIKALVLCAQETKKLGPFEPEKFPHAAELNYFVETKDDGLYITNKLLNHFFKYYPALDYVSISLEK
jgi:hypothetical protein